MSPPSQAGPPGVTSRPTRSDVLTQERWGFGRMGGVMSAEPERGAGEERAGAGHWTEPGVELVAPGVHRVPLPLPMDGLRAVNVYVLETDDGLTCIDAGWAIAASRELLETGLRSIGHQVSDIRRFLVTHVHRDHYTQAVTVRKEFGRATVELGLGEKPTLDLFHSEDLDEDPTVDRLRSAGANDLAEKWRRMFEGREPDLDMWAYPDTWLDGEVLLEVGGRTLRAVPTP